jgi:hypothetical protein
MLHKFTTGDRARAQLSISNDQNLSHIEKLLEKDLEETFLKRAQLESHIEKLLGSPGAKLNEKN